MAINFNMIMSVPETAADLKEKLRLDLTDDNKTRAIALAQYLENAAGGQNAGNLALTLHVAGVKATGTVTLASTLAADTVTIDGVTLTAVSGAPAAGQFDMSGTDTQDAVSFCAAVAGNAQLASKIVATSALGVVTLTAIGAGVTSNSITLASSNGGRLAVSAARLAGGTSGTAYTISL